MKNILTGRMPFAISVNGAQFILRTDFRLWIQAGELIQKIGKAGDYIRRYAEEKNRKRLEEKVDAKNNLLSDLCDLVIEEYPKDNFVLGDDLIFGLVEFYKGFPQPPKSEAQKKKEAGKPKKEECRNFDFNFDAGYVYCSFASFYGIRLQTIEYMHWWEFLELFNGLMMSDQTSVNFVVGTRQQKIRSDMPKAEKARLQKLKKQFELPADEDTTEAKNKTLDFLRKGKQDGV